MDVLFVVALVLLVSIGPGLVLVAAWVRRRQTAKRRRRGFDVEPPDGARRR